MSYTNFIKAMDLAPKCNFFTTAGGKTEEEIKMSEKMLGVYFSTQCKEFYERYGYLSFLVMKYMELTQRMIREY